VLLAGYLPSFTKACGTAHHVSFIDAFAGESVNVERHTGRPIPNSPRVALSTRPRFTHVLAFERPEKASALQAALRREYPDRKPRVIGGDVNTTLQLGLDWWRAQGTGPNYGPHLGPALAYLDPNSLELDWRTIRTLAMFLRDSPVRGIHKRRRPIELLILFPTGPMRRILPQPPKRPADAKAREPIDRLFGGLHWQAIYQDQINGRLDPGESSWLHYVHQYRWQLAELGYPHTSAIEVRNTRGACSTT
jgi:three-Cys-motif partner protein